MHHLVHLPQQMLRFVPLRNTWCMQFESKNKELKQYTSSCFKNVSLSIAIKHQQSLCYLLAVPPGSSTSSLLYPEDEVLEGCLCVVEDDLIDKLKEGFGLEDVPYPFLVLKPNSVKIHGIKYA